MNHLSRMVSVAVMALTAAAVSVVDAHVVKTIADDLSSAKVMVYFTGVLYRSGMKITRPGATTNGKYPPGSFAVVANDGSTRYPGLGANRLDWGAAVGDHSRAPWRIAFAMPVKGFSATCYDPPSTTVKSTDICWIRLYDYQGTLLAEKSVKRSTTSTTASTVTATAPYQGVWTAEFGADQDSPAATSPGVDWGGFSIDTGVES